MSDAEDRDEFEEFEDVGVPELPPVPEELHSAYEEGPFRKCVACDADLTGPEAIYQIQKTWKNDDVIFELAVCAECANKAAQDFSQESFERIQEFLLTRYQPSFDFGECHFCRQRLDGDEPAEYEMGGYCRGGRLLRPVVVICTKCSEKSQENLSEQTRKAWGDFVDRNVPGVPFSLEPDSIPVIF
jgi:hypothetical protein